MKNVLMVILGVYLLIRRGSLEEDKQMLDLVMDMKPRVIGLSIFFEDYFNLVKESREVMHEALQMKREGDLVGYQNLLKKYNVYLAAADAILEVAIKRPTVKA